MPYVKPEYRTTLDPAVRDLAARIVALARTMPDETAFAGLLNYACTSVAMHVVEERFGRIRYGTIATLTGVFKNIADEFYRRVAAPYEDQQIAANGDVPSYEARSPPFAPFARRDLRPGGQGKPARSRTSGRAQPVRLKKRGR